jgi:hypothetical protein
MSNVSPVRFAFKGDRTDACVSRVHGVIQVGRVCRDSQNSTAGSDDVVAIIRRSRMEHDHVLSVDSDVRSKPRAVDI